MRAITICQPYTHLVMRGEKRVENRTWQNSYRGPLLIHAGKSRDWLELSDDGTHDELYGIPLADMTFGAVVAVAELRDCVSVARLVGGGLHIHRHARDRWPWLASHEHTEGPYCFVLAEPRPLPEPIAWRGAQGLWTPTAELIGRVREQLEVISS